MEVESKFVKVTLVDGTPIYIRAKVIEEEGMGEEDVAFKVPSFEQVTKAIQGVAEALHTAWSKAKPSRACVEFGVEFALEPGTVTAVFVDGSTTASMNITLEWGEPSPPDTHP